MHADTLVPDWGSTPKEAVRAYVDATLRGEAVIGVRRRDGVIVEAWITEDPTAETDKVCSGEVLEMLH
jgi:hypothetical protein